MDQDKVARLLHEHFMEWANRLNSGGGEYKVRRQWAAYDQSWDRLSEDRKQVFTGLAGQVAGAMKVAELEAKIIRLEKELAQPQTVSPTLPKKPKAKKQA